ncbi:inorganic polyphosphate kinase [Patulibacter minatonensis]|uniref:inorganic polyphosphate kinase n=1 Tax=Patulibacter minatonensis TaxID=298163 RepID=UPI00047D9450|nr:inorganic polyphosphate kinase [Patulibacter minatonensis]
MLRRAVLVERPTELQELLQRHGTREQARFFLRTRGLDLAETEERHLRHEEARATVLRAVPSEWRTATVRRDELDRFLFEQDDLVLVLGPDGLVANVAKYLDGQPLAGLDPDPGFNPGVLVTHAPAATADLCADVAAERTVVRERTMVAATLDDGRTLTALNELFLGHRSHQSARYELAADGRREHQSSSGLIVTTGTGATGWAASINRARPEPLALPGPADPALAWFVREAWPGPRTATTLTAGALAAGDTLEVVSENGDGGVLFGDGIEADHVPLDWGQRVTIGVADRRLRVLV